ncbi:hypothetical protein HPB49_020202 [Dermacentor silvarum]|uniref:Uncharacterized protein n=1 Tax=Dermacentor silvarum TaxID=543639 RepID=A0ACB8C593_DERSI|nr:hypothetical protein HPB49_020202 [Dermacentor silvarum]
MRCSPDGTRTAPPSPPRRQTKWRPRHTPRLSRDDDIVVLKPRVPFELKSVLPSDRAGDAIRAYLGEHSSTSFHVWPVWDQNVLVCSVTSLPMAQRRLGDIQLPVGDQQLLFRGHAKASGEICRGVITINPAETPQRIKSELEWSQGAILAVRKLGDSTAAVVTFEGTKLPRFIFYHSVVAYVRPYKKTIPACSLCGTIGHRPSACPRPTPGRCTRCGTQVQVTSEGLAEHECNPTCLLCSGPHETGARGCPGKYRKPTPPSTSKPPAPPSPGTRAASLPKPGSRLQTPANPPPTTSVHYPPLVVAPLQSSPLYENRTLFFSGKSQLSLSRWQVSNCNNRNRQDPPLPLQLLNQPSPRATPTPRTPPAPPASSTAPAAQSVTGAPQSPLSIDYTLPLEDRITRLENVVLYQISTINVQYIVPEVVQAVQAWALTHFRTRSSRSRSASTSSSSAPRRRKVAGSSSPALNPASIPFPTPQGMEDDPQNFGFSSWRLLHLHIRHHPNSKSSSGTPGASGTSESARIFSSSFNLGAFSLPSCPPRSRSKPYPFRLLLLYRRHHHQNAGPSQCIFSTWYCPPHLQRVTFAELFYRALQAAARQLLVVVGDFNAPSPHQRYHYEKARGRKLKELISTLGFALLTDPAHPTRLGNSVTRDTCPDLSLTRNIRHVTWENLEDTLDKNAPNPGRSPHHGLVSFSHYAFPPAPIPVGLPGMGIIRPPHPSIMHPMNLYLHLSPRSRSPPPPPLGGTPQPYPPMATIQAKSLLDPSTTRGETQRQLRRAYYAYQGPTSQLANDLCERYLCHTVDPKGPESSQKFAY